MTIIEGTTGDGDRTESALIADYRFRALAEAVREHQIQARRSTPLTKPRDERLYRRLRQICGELPADEPARSA